MGKVRTAASWRAGSPSIPPALLGAFIFGFCALAGRSGEAVKIQREVGTVDGSIENLTAEAISVDHSLQLRIKWNVVNIKETQLFLEIKPFKDVAHCTSKKPCYEYNLDPATTELLVPRDPMSTLDPENRECTLELGCRYEIQLGSNNYKYSKKIVYQVAECVDGDCLCAHRTALPTIGIAYLIESASELRLIWNISQSQELPAGVYVDKIAISLGRQTNPSLKWGGSVQTVYDLMQSLVQDDGNVTVLPEDINYPIGHVKIDHTLIGGSKYTAKMTAVDNYNCHGPEASLTISTPMPSTRTPHTQTSDAFYMWQITAIVAALALLSLLGLLLVRFKFMRGLNASKEQSWQAVYHHIPTNKRIQHISMHENTMYVDKDIWDARGRGEADHLEVPHSCLKIGREIGKGAFGRVFIARAENIKGYTLVAVKQLKKKPSSDEIDEFISEITTMKTVAPHPNVVSLLGCCTIRQPFLMIMEYVGCGDLLHYLRKVRSMHEARTIQPNGFWSSQQHSSCSSDVFGSTQIISEHTAAMPASMDHHGPKGKYLDLHYTSSTSTSGSTYPADSSIFPPSLLRPSVTETQYTTLSKYPTADGSIGNNALEYLVDHKELHNFATQIARGMKHLHKQHITHRDLAARNILIDENKTLKISDFGLSRSGIYVNTRNKKVPLRWLSLEAMRDSLYSAKSDVWAFGVVLWEIGTLGGFPYPTVSNEELLTYLLSGRRLERPENCSELLYELMLTCWAPNADDRPDFAKIVSQLEPDHQKIYVDFNELRVDYVFPPIVEVSAHYRNVPPENVSLITSSSTATDSTAKR